MFLIWRLPHFLFQIINGLSLGYYVLFGNRGFEEYARNNWTDTDKEKRQAIAVAEPESGLSDVESKNTSTQAPPDVSNEAPPNATQLNIIGELPEISRDKSHAAGLLRLELLQYWSVLPRISVFG
ncbi:hypothetical protein HPB48_009021 [Haemaphysalis longicornis]|uniref:Uncharacterized protein n=1 Tax=Haemaphysalis longicornis TaxID=44386 RepID=A0A9J6H3T4_HAELO|nr:hypothetical protein HPB48_009021 [Haemaphysalis longicornis]